MLPEISLNVLDIAQNSVRANASLIEISVAADSTADALTIVIKDNGCGMTEEQVAHVTDPFFTTRTTRKVGLGVPFYKAAAEASGGRFSIVSVLGQGTEVTAVFGLSHIDRMPLGDMTATMVSLITMNPTLDFVYRYTFDQREFSLDTREMKAVLDGVPLNTPEVAAYLRDYLSEHKAQVDKNTVI